MSVHAWYLQRLEEGARSPGTGVTNGCEPPRRWAELSWGPLRKQQVLLTVQSSLQAHTAILTFDAKANGQLECGQRACYRLLPLTKRMHDMLAVMQWLEAGPCIPQVLGIWWGASMRNRCSVEPGIVTSLLRASDHVPSEAHQDCLSGGPRIPFFSFSITLCAFLFLIMK